MFHSAFVSFQTNPANWTSIVHTYFYEYKDAHPSWDEFDVSPCLGRIDRMALSLSLDCSYKQVFSYDAELTKNSLRKAIAGIAGISALRVTDVFVSYMTLIIKHFTLIQTKKLYSLLEAVQIFVRNFVHFFICSKYTI